MSARVKLLFAITFTLKLVEGNIFMWSNKQFQIPALKYFDDAEFIALQETLINPHIIAFRGNLSQVSSISKKLFAEKHTAYVPNGRIDVQNVIDLDGNQDVEKIITERTRNSGNNYIGVILDDVQTRTRRSANDGDDENDEDEDKDKDKKIFYISQQGQAIIYSSKPLLLKVNNSTEYRLGVATVTTLDTRDTYTRLSATIPFDEKDKLTLRFKFNWRLGYWSMSLIELEYSDSRKYSLILNDELVAAKNFSYHCAGRTMFKDAENGVELTLYDLQAQPDAKNGIFNDAYDCVPFTTAPIWSGMFVVSFLLVVLGIGLNALGSIKITHGCENIKLKELCIAVGNE